MPIRPHAGNATTGRDDRAHDGHDPVRRSLLQAGLPAGLLLLNVPALAAQSSPAATAAGPGTPAPLPPPTARTVLLSGDGEPQSPQDLVRALEAGVARGADVVDRYFDGGAVGELERAFARLLGKEDAAFVASGTQANTLALRVLCGEHRRALVQHDSHVHLDESDACSILNGLHLVPLAKGRASPAVDEVRDAIDEAERGPYPLKIGAISLESPVRRHDGERIPFDVLQAISRLARDKGIGLHLDGARLLLGAGLPGFDLQAHAALFDTVYVSLYKYLGAPFGAILAGPRAAIAQVRDARHVFGGALYRAWPAALPVLGRLDGFMATFAQARAAAEAVFAGLERLPGLRIARVPNQSNIAFLELPAGQETALRERLLAHDIRGQRPREGRMQLDINPTWLRRPPAEIVRAFAPG